MEEAGHKVESSERSVKLRSDGRVRVGLLIAFVGLGFLSAMLGRANSRHSYGENDIFAKARADHCRVRWHGQLQGDERPLQWSGVCDARLEHVFQNGAQAVEHAGFVALHERAVAGDVGR